jgi:hypothetical protein
MSAIANIVAFDGAASPVSHTFLPVSVVREKEEVIAEWREALSAVPVYAQPRVTMRMKKMGSGVYRVSSRVSVPVMETVGAQNAAGYTAAPKVAYENTQESIGYFHERSDITGRRLVRQLANNIMNGVATSVAPVTTGPIADLFDLLSAPN